MANNPNCRANLRQGGTNKGGTGRPSKTLKETCLKIASNPKVLKFLEDVVTGVGVEPKVVWNVEKKKNEIMYLPADADTRAKVWEKLADRGAGKAPQAIEHSGSIDMNAEAAKKEIEAGVNAYLVGKLHA